MLFFPVSPSPHFFSFFLPPPSFTDSVAFLYLLHFPISHPRIRILPYLIASLSLYCVRVCVCVSLSLSLCVCVCVSRM